MLLAGLETGLDVNARSAGGNTALMYACMEHWPRAVAALLTAGESLDINAVNETGESALRMAQELDDVETANLLLAVRSIDRDAGVPRAVRECAAAAVKSVVAGAKEEVVRLDPRPATALRLPPRGPPSEAAGARADTAGAVATVAEGEAAPSVFRGAEVDWRMRVTAMRSSSLDSALTAQLFEAVSNNDAVAVRSLLQSHAANLDVNATDELGHTPLMLAARSGFAAVVDTLCEADGKLVALRHEHVDALVVWIDMAATNRIGESALHFASREGHAEAVRELLRPRAMGRVAVEEGMQWAANEAGLSPWDLATDQATRDVLRELAGIEPQASSRSTSHSGSREQGAGSRWSASRLEGSLSVASEEMAAEALSYLAMTPLEILPSDSSDTYSSLLSDRWSDRTTPRTSRLTEIR